MRFKKLLNLYGNKFSFLNDKWRHRLLKVIFYIFISIGAIIAITLPIVDSTTHIIEDPNYIHWYTKDNTNRIYYIDSLISNNDYSEYDIGCVSGTSFFDIYNKDVLDILKLYRSGKEYKFFLSI